MTSRSSPPAAHDSGREPVVAWRPWQLEPLELFEATALSTPRRRHFSRGCLLVVAMHAGASTNEYRRCRADDRGRRGMFRVFEAEEAWSCQPHGASFICLTVEPRWLRGFAEATLHRERAVPHFASSACFDAELTEALGKLAAASRRRCSRLEQDERIAGVLAPLLLRHGEPGGALRSPRREHPSARRAREHLEAHYADEVPLQALAKVARLSPFHLARVFREAIGLPPHAYQTQLRLAHARKLLGEGLDVGQVAQHVGFFDQSHFAQHFRRYFYVRPSRYGKMARTSSLGSADEP
jgi:AraC-like DNA-binding protein